MSPVADALLRGSLVVLAGLGATAALRRRSAALRHWVLAIAIACGAAVPVLQAALPAWHVGVAFGHAVRPDGTGVEVETSVSAAPASGNTRTPTAPRVVRSAQPPAPVRWSRVILGTWLAGVLIALSMLVVGLWRASRIAAAATILSGGPLVAMASEISKTIGRRQAVTLLQSSDPGALMTWGALRPVIVLPLDAPNWSEERARIVLRHEFAHIARGDWLVQMVAETLSALYWFNPVFWIAAHRLRSESERACDDAVLTAGIDATRYASHLLELARTAGLARPVPAMARSSSLEGRVAAMLNYRTNRRPLREITRLATAVIFAVLTVPLAMAQARFWTFSGTVVDQTSRTVPDVALVLTNPSTHAKYEVRTDRVGRFQFVGLQSGDYELEARQAGFKTYKGTVSVADQDLTRTIQLDIGQLHETINVRSGPTEAAAKAEPRQANVEERRTRAEQARRGAAKKCDGGAPAGDTGGNILAPLKVIDVKPLYSDSMKAARIAGVVTLDAIIGTDGTVRDVTVVSSPYPELDRAAADAVRQWEFTTTYLNCTPVEVPMRVTVNFIAQ